jgi:seryl-tRNA synthetase
MQTRVEYLKEISAYFKPGESVTVGCTKNGFVVLHDEDMYTCSDLTQVDKTLRSLLTYTDEIQAEQVAAETAQKAEKMTKQVAELQEQVDKLTEAFGQLPKRTGHSKPKLVRDLPEPEPEPEHDGTPEAS